MPCTGLAHPMGFFSLAERDSATIMQRMHTGARTLLLLLVSLLLPSTLLATTPRPREYWEEIIRRDHAVPQGTTALALARELTGFLGHADPLWRDEFGFSITAAWVQKGLLGPEDLRALMPLWLEGLERAGQEQALTRSFAALNLSLVAALEANRPFLTQEEFARLLSAALHELRTETDLRGWVPGIGWVHATAHSADLLRQLARSPRLAPADQEAILAGLADLLRRAYPVFNYGEPERLARIVVRLSQREDFALAAWQATAQRLASLPEGFSGVHPEPAPYAAKRNAQAFLAAAHLQLLASKSRNCDAAAAAISAHFRP